MSLEFLAELNIDGPRPLSEPDIERLREAVMIEDLAVQKIGGSYRIIKYDGEKYREICDIAFGQVPLRYRSRIDELAGRPRNIRLLELIGHWPGRT